MYTCFSLIFRIKINFYHTALSTPYSTAISFVQLAIEFKQDIHNIKLLQLWNGVQTQHIHEMKCYCGMECKHIHKIKLQHIKQNSYCGLECTNIIK